MKQRNVEGIILSRINFGEADRLILIFTKELGKIKVVARGSRKIKSKMACFLEPFTVGKYHLISGKNNYIMAGAESLWCSVDSASRTDSYEILSYMAEVINMTFEESQEDADFYNIAKTLFEMTGDIKKQGYYLALKNIFEIKLLSHLGYMPELRNCSGCKNPLESQDYYAGGIAGVFCKHCRKGNDIRLNTLKALHFIKNNELDSIFKVGGLDKISPEIEGMINPLLCDILPRKPRSIQICQTKN